MLSGIQGTFLSGIQGTFLSGHKTIFQKSFVIIWNSNSIMSTIYLAKIVTQKFSIKKEEWKEERAQ